MSKADRIIIGTAVVWGGVLVAFMTRASMSTQLTSMLLTPFFLGASIWALVRCFTQWKKQRAHALIPLVTCLTVLFGFPWVGLVARRTLRAIELPRYERVVEAMNAGRIEVPAYLNRVPEAESEARSAYGVLAVRDSTGVL